MNALPAHILLSRRLTVWSLLALIVLCLAWELVWAPLRPGGSWLVLKALPLCLPLAGLLRHRMYTYRWLSLFIWFYFTEGVVRATSESFPAAGLACFEILLSLLIFVGCAMHVRMRFRAARAQTSVASNT